MHTTPWVALSIVALAVLSTDAVAGADTCYDVEEIVVEEGYSPSTLWTDINASGDMVGNHCLDETCAPEIWTYDAPQNGAIYDAATGDIESFSPPEGYTAIGSVGMSDSGLVVGDAWGTTDTGYVFVGFVYEDGVATVIDNPVEGTTDFAVSDINNAGTMVGYSYCSEGDCAYVGWEMDKYGELTLLEVEGAYAVLPYSISNNGTISGLAVGIDWDALSYYGAAFVMDASGDVATYASYDEDSFVYYTAFGVTNQGAVVGQWLEYDSTYFTVLDSGAFTWSEGEDAVHEELSDYSDYFFTGINASGDISGTADSGYIGLLLSRTKCD